MHELPKIYKGEKSQILFEPSDNYAGFRQDQSPNFGFLEG
mgnify:CR=1 FL=1